MRAHSWDGLTLEDDYQAQAIARVLEQFTSKGVETWVRFAHEINWYLTDGTYSGGVEDFKAGWAAVANAVKDNPLVKMFFTPNIAASLDDYTRFFPDDKSTVHIIGIGEQRGGTFVSSLSKADSVHAQTTIRRVVPSRSWSTCSESESGSL